MFTLFLAGGNTVLAVAVVGLTIWNPTLPSILVSIALVAMATYCWLNIIRFHKRWGKWP